MTARRLSLILTFSIVLTAGAMQGSTLRQGPRQYRVASGTSSKALFSSDNWLGGTGNWSNPAGWSDGLPGSSSDVLIGTAHDRVTLDTSADIQSLTIGNGSGTSGLAGNLTAQTLNVAGDVTLNGTSDVSLQTDTLNVGGNLNLAGANYASNFEITWGSTVNVAGNVTNSGAIYLSDFGNGGDKLTVTGSLTNNPGSKFLIEGAGDLVTLGSLINNGELDVLAGTTLNLTSQGGYTEIPIGSTWEIHSTFLAQGNDPFAHLQTINGHLDLEDGIARTITPGNGTLFFNHGGGLYSNAPLTINGNVNVSWGGLGGVNTTINGGLTIGFGSDVGGTVTVTDATQVQGFIQLYNSDVFTTPLLANGGFTYLQQQSSMIVGEGGQHMPLGPGYHQLATGVLEELMSNLQIGLLQAQSASLDGTLDIQLAPGFLPAVGSRYNIIYVYAGTITGEFATIENDVFNDGTEKWVVNYDTQDGFVQLIAESNIGTTPEPGTLWLLSTGLLASTGFLRRGRKSGSPRSTRSARRLGRELK